MKKILLLTSSLLLSCSLFAQDINDVLRFSQNGINGTSNYISKAGAIGALGGDMTAASYNPAGLGLYRSSEITFSSGLFMNFTDAGSESDSRTNFMMGNLGMLLNFKAGGSSVKNVQFGFGFNRLKSFGNRTVISSTTGESFIPFMIRNEQRYSDEFLYDFKETGVILQDNDGYYDSFFYNNVDAEFYQLRAFKESGYLNEMTFSMSTNIDNKLYLGGTIGVPYGWYRREGTFNEQRYDIVQNAITDEYTYSEDYELDVTGINLKVGAIFQPADFIRLGAAIHTPTFYNVEEDLYSSVKNHNNNRVSGGEWPTLTYDMQTPLKLIPSVAFIFGNNKSKIGGTVSIDYEYSNFSWMKFRLDGAMSEERAINNDIEDMFKSSHTLRVGGELKVGMYAIRGGFGYFSNPYSKYNTYDNNNRPVQEDINDASQILLSCGFGYKSKHYFIDLAYAYAFNNNGKFIEYDGYPFAIKNNQHVVQATFGVRF